MYRKLEEKLNDDKKHSQKNTEIIINTLPTEPSGLVDEYSIARN